jgi:hypothetical protein
MERLLASVGTSGKRAVNCMGHTNSECFRTLNRGVTSLGVEFFDWEEEEEEDEDEGGRLELRDD